MSAFERRSQLLRTNCVPGLHETTDNLGDALGKTILKTMSPVAQELMGVKKPLSTAPSQMWVDPNDLLNSNVVIRPPTTSSCLKAFTHQKILEFGKDIEQKIQHERDVLVDNAIGDTTEFERFVCKQKVDFAVKQGQDELHQVLVDQRNELLNIFQDDRQQMIEEHTEASEKLVASLKEQHKLATAQQMLEMRTEYEQQINECEVKMQESEQKYKKNLEESKQQMKMALHATRIEYFDLMKKLHAEFKQRLEEQKNQLQCQHMCEMMHVICAEKNDAQKKLLMFKQGQKDQKGEIQLSQPSIIDSTGIDKTPVNSIESLPEISKSNQASSQPLSSTKYVQTERESSESFLNACIKEAAVKPASRPFVIGACEIAEPPSVSSSVSSDSIALESSLSSLEYDNCRYVKMTTTAIDPRLLRCRECDEDDDVSWNTITDMKSNVSLVKTEHGSMNNLVLDCNDNAIIVKIRSKLINLLDTVNELHPMTDSLELVRNQIGTMINDLIDNTDSPTSTIATSVAPIKHSKLLSTTDSYELIPLRKPVNAEIIEAPILLHSEKVDLTTTKDLADAEHMIRGKNLQLSSHEYFESKKLFPSYMQPQRNTSTSLFNYTPTSEPEWKKLLQNLNGNKKGETEEIFDITSEDFRGEKNNTEPDKPGRSQSISMSETLKHSQPNPILRKFEKPKVTVRSLLELLERGDDDVAEQFFGRIPKSE